MNMKKRILFSGGAAALLLGGIIVDAATNTLFIEAVAIVLMAFGGILFMALLFLEVGLSEDRERARGRS